MKAASCHSLRQSLTLRVTAMFVLVVALSAAGLGMYLYRAFVGELERRDDIQLLGKLRQVQMLLGRPGAAELVSSQPDYFRDTMSGQENSLVRLLAPGGAVLVDINASGESYPVPASAGWAPGPASIAHWSSSRNAPGRVIAGSARLGGGEVTVIVARVYAERSAMLARYRGQIAGAVLVSALLAALLAALILRRGLRPLRTLAQQAALVKPGTLAQRLDVDAAPSELRPLIEAFNAMLARLQEGYLRLSSFSADLAHEFRTPISNMLVQSQVMLANARTATEYEQLIASNIEELERLARMIGSMLFLARAAQDDVVLARQQLSALGELQNACDFFSGMADERGLRLDCVGDGQVWADPNLLRRALANLVSNAVRHADQGSTVTLRAIARDGATEIRVANRGIPVGPQHLDRLFERFFRADAARSNAYGSTGLGLSIVRAIMDLHGGAINVRTHADLIEFTLIFPAAAAPGCAG
nr:heavy metal sensor histidine kinase [Janthinobacterium sp. CG3]